MRLFVYHLYPLFGFHCILSQQGCSMIFSLGLSPFVRVFRFQSLFFMLIQSFGKWPEHNHSFRTHWTNWYMFVIFLKVVVTLSSLIFSCNFVYHLHEQTLLYPSRSFSLVLGNIAGPCQTGTPCKIMGSTETAGLGGYVKLSFCAWRVLKYLLQPALHELGDCWLDGLYKSIKQPSIERD